MHRDFETFRLTSPPLHLVVGHVVDDASATDMRVLRKRLRNMLEATVRLGDYATAWVRGADFTEIHCLFATVEDAKAFAACFGARRCARQGYASRHRFMIDAALRNGLLALPGISAGTGQDAALAEANRG